MNKEFIKAILARAGHTAAQAAVAVIGTSALMEEVNWLAVLSTAALAAILSILKSFAVGVPEAVKDNGPEGE